MSCRKAVLRLKSTTRVHSRIKHKNKTDEMWAVACWWVGNGHFVHCELINKITWWRNQINTSSNKCGIRSPWWTELLNWLYLILQFIATLSHYAFWLCTSIRYVRIYITSVMRDARNRFTPLVIMCVCWFAVDWTRWLRKLFFIIRMCDEQIEQCLVLKEKFKTITCASHSVKRALTQYAFR